MAKTLNYNKEYFNKRDHLDLLIAESIKIFLKEKSLIKILDVGCGTGKLVKFFNQNDFQALGCDPSKEAVKMAQKINYPNSIKKARATKLPYKTASFDLVTSISVIEHLKQQESAKFLNEAKRVLKPNGYIFIITPNFSSPFRYILGKRWFAHSDPTHINYFTPKSLKSLLLKSKFKNVTFRLKTAYNVPFDWYLPKPLRKFPMPAKNLMNYLMISSPLSTMRDSLWVLAQNK